MFKNTNGFIGKIQLDQIENGDRLKNMLLKFDNEYKNIRFKNVPITEDDLDYELQQLIINLREMSKDTSNGTYPGMVKELENLKEIVRRISFQMEGTVQGCHLKLYRRKDEDIGWNDLDYNLQARISQELSNGEDLLENMVIVDEALKAHIGVNSNGKKQVDQALDYFTRNYNNKPVETHNELPITDYLNFLFSTVDFKTREDYQYYTPSGVGSLYIPKENIDNVNVFDLGTIRTLDENYLENFGTLFRSKEYIMDI